MPYKNPISQTYDSLTDDFPHLKVLLPGAIFLTAVVNSGWSAWEFAWSFSYWLEAIAFIPQIMVQKKISSREIATEDISTSYVVVLASYRTSYIISWICTFYTDDYY